VDASPKYSDSDYTLVFKIVALKSAASGGVLAPSARDTYHTLLFKWAKLTELYG
jgi:hypothetical protein